MNQLVFLPGASGSRNFWQPLITSLQPKHYQVLAYPGFDGVEAHPDIQNLGGLQQYLSTQIADDSILVAQSMGGVLAAGSALTQPEQVKALVLIATSGGLNLQGFGCADWRTDYREQYSQVPDWFVTDQTVFSAEQLAQIKVPVLLIWGDQDPLSTVAVGQYLSNVFGNALLHVIQDADHQFASSHAEQVSKLIQSFFEKLKDVEHASQ
ncbi:alpha/beta hydrolase [Acinetobacter sp. LoGeW2-3]|uniref:alpha/beta fold hydrolase n=1 Tax=Acinetobacter sp. LoGeW2-3 TaxID=1808001 RepID=UPI000C0591A6|nr:alpha/beta hydrolase [Acinetobacter sp. LoGeW2-3]ATO21045.1 alpha/beta hydrolase [Acinetobacter sp. LoGeW2-3]